jgi:hypothetical protein
VGGRWSVHALVRFRLGAVGVVKCSDKIKGKLRKSMLINRVLTIRIVSYREGGLAWLCGLGFWGGEGLRKAELRRRKRARARIPPLVPKIVPRLQLGAASARIYRYWSCIGQSSRRISVRMYTYIASRCTKCLYILYRHTRWQ